MSKQTEQTSKLLSFVLRHSPEAIGVQLDEEGWADIDKLIALANARGHRLSRELLELVVLSSDKQRFAIDGSGTRIRANQGHSIAVDLMQRDGLAFYLSENGVWLTDSVPVQYIDFEASQGR
jgi:putative RNA 2'-phosphotransferase